MSDDQHEAGPLWADGRILNEAEEATYDLDGGTYVRHVINQLLLKMRKDYETQADDLRRQLAECQQRLAEASEWEQITYIRNDQEELFAGYAQLTIAMNGVGLGTIEWPNDGYEYAVCKRTSAPTAHTLESVLREVTEWQHEQFPHRTAHSIATHLLEEAQELHRQPTDAEEMADVLMLLAGLAHFNSVNLADVVRTKLAKNKARTWGKPNGDGVVKHVDTAPTAQDSAQEVASE